MNEIMNNKELVAAGHEFARHMSSDTPIIDIAKMVTRLASQLDVTTAALRQANAQLESQSLELKAAVAAEIDWEKSMMQAVGADGIADVVSAIEKLKADGAALAAENAALRLALNPESIPDAAIESVNEIAKFDHDWNEWSEWYWIKNEEEVVRAVLDAMPQPETLATAKFIAEQQAIGVKKVGEYLRVYAQGIHEEARLVLQDACELCQGFAVKLRDEVHQ